MGAYFPSFGRVQEALVDEFRKHVLPPPPPDDRPPAFSQLTPPPPPPAVKPPASRDTARVKEKPPSAARVNAYNPVLEKTGQTTAQRRQREKKAKGALPQKDKGDEAEEEEDEEVRAARRRRRRLQLKLKPLDTSQGGELEGGDEEDSAMGKTKEAAASAKEEKKEGVVDTDAAESVDAQSVAVAEPIPHIDIDTAPVDPRYLGHPDQSKASWRLHCAALSPHVHPVDRRCCPPLPAVLLGSVQHVPEVHRQERSAGRPLPLPPQIHRSRLPHRLGRCSPVAPSTAALPTSLPSSDRRPICPCAFFQIEEWTEARKAGRWFGVPVPYHPGEMDLRELLQQSSEEEKPPEETLHVDALPAEGVTQPREPVVNDAELAQEAEDVRPGPEAERVAETGVQPLPEGVEEVRPEVQGRVREVGVEPVMEDEVGDLREVERRERLRLWELQQRRRQRERQAGQDRADMRTMIDRAMTSIHK